MSEQGFRGVPGVPEGWELVGIRQIEDGEWSVGAKGEPYQWSGETSCSVYPVIRKIEQAPKYRPFESAEEFKPHRDRWVRVVKEDNMCGCDLEEHTGGFEKIVAYEEDGEPSVCVYGGWITCDEAFECFVFDDGTPFGVKIDGN